MSETLFKEVRYTLGGLVNAIFQPDPEHLLRVDVGVAFRRARLEGV